MYRCGLCQQALIDALLLPVARLEVRAQNAQIDQRKFAPDQFGQQRRELVFFDTRQGLGHGGENCRFHQRLWHRCRDAKDFPLVTEIVAAIRIGGIDAHLLLATEHQHRRPRHDQWPQRLQFWVLQRIDRVIGLDRRQDYKRIAIGVMQQSRTGHRQIGDAPGAHQITEVDHTLQLPMPLGITRPDDVVIGDVHVNRLHRQFVQQRLQTALGLLGGNADRRTLLRVSDHRQQMTDQSVGVTRVPLQGAFKTRVIETCQGQIHLATEPAKPGDHALAKMIEIGQRLAVDVLQQPHMHRFAVGLQGQQVFTVIGSNHARYLDRRVLGQILEAGVLGLQLHKGVVATADFQDEAPARTVDAIIQILLAAQRLQRTDKSVIFGQPLQRLRL